MARSDKFGHEKSRRKDAARRAKDTSGASSVISPTKRDEMKERVRDILRNLEEITLPEGQVFTKTYNIDTMITTSGRGGYERTCNDAGIPYDAESHTDQGKREKLIEDIKRGLLEKGGDTLADYCPVYLLLSLVSAEKAEALRLHLLQETEGQYTLQLTLPEVHAARSRLATPVTRKNTPQ